MRNFASIAVLIFSVFVLAFLAGTVTARFNVFPYPSIRDAALTFRSLVSSLRPEGGKRLEKTKIPAEKAADSRWIILDPSVPRFPVIANGGLYQYQDLCPKFGCLAVSYDAAGEISQTWHYRPDAVFALDSLNGSHPHETVNFDPVNDVYPLSVQRYAGGDILVNFQGQPGRAFPFGMGVARIRPDGTPVWTRQDYSHHWSTLTPDGIAYVPSLKIGEANLSFTQGEGSPKIKHHVLKCESHHPQLDTVQVIDSAGKLIEEIELVPLFVKSNWVGHLTETSSACDPLHLNYIDLVGSDAGPGLEPGDLVLSLRNISRFAILDRKTRKIKRVVAGSFVHQHSVHHLSGSKFLIFDNRGGDSQGPASRIVELDLATGIERRVFPNADTPQKYAHIFSDVAGYIDISPDRKRVLASFTHAGRAFEVDIKTGRLIAVFDNLHDISDTDDGDDEADDSAVRFSIYGLSYLKP